MDDRFQIASFMEEIRSTGRLRWFFGVSGITLPAVCCVCSCNGKNESGDCLPEVALPLPPHPPTVPFFFVKRKSARSPDIPLSLTLPVDLLFEYSSSSK